MRCSGCCGAGPVLTACPLLSSPCQVKCDQYWPSRGTETYGMIQVTMLDTVELATYSVRTFALYKVHSSFLFAHIHVSRLYRAETGEQLQLIITRGTVLECHFPCSPKIDKGYRRFFCSFSLPPSHCCNWFLASVIVCSSRKDSRFSL